MHKYIALLRAINVGGHNVKMAVLKEHFGTLGFSAVETLLASGNVIFDSPESDRKGLAERIANTLQEKLGYEVATFIRTPAEIAAVMAYQPFAAEEMAAAGALCVAFMTAPLNREKLAALAELETDIDSFNVNGTEVYWMCALKQNESNFSNAVFEKKLGISATFRGMKTVARLATKYAD